MRPRADSGGWVYSTDAGRMCPGCRRAAAQCVCASAKLLPVGDGIVRVSRESKGRGGKVVTVIKGVIADEAALVQLGKQLKALCGSGGTVKDRVIEVQGDHMERVMAGLQKLGYITKRVGG